MACCAIEFFLLNSDEICLRAFSLPISVLGSQLKWIFRDGFGLLLVELIILSCLRLITRK